MCAVDRKCLEVRIIDSPQPGYPFRANSVPGQTGCVGKSDVNRLTYLELPGRTELNPVFAPGYKEIAEGKPDAGNGHDHSNECRASKGDELEKLGAIDEKLRPIDRD